MICRYIVGVTLIASMVFTSPQRPPIATRVPPFADLQEGDEMIVDYVSDGCFHSEHEVFAFTKFKGTSVSISYIEHIRHENEPDILNPISLGTAKLSEKDIKGIDALLGFYRAPRRGGCTTKDKVTFIHRRDRMVMAKETFVDASCSSYNLKDVTRLEDLVTRLIEKAPGGKVL